MEGILVNQHLGEATQLWIFGIRDGKPEIDRATVYTFRGQRIRTMDANGDILNDCNTILVSGIGANPLITLERCGHTGGGHGGARKGRY